MRDFDELRQLTAGRLLAIWRESAKETEEPIERALLCNARVLAESCFYEGQAVFQNGEEVLGVLTSREMETLLRQLAAETVPKVIVQNPAFDQGRFLELQRR